MPISYLSTLHRREECFPFGENAFGGYAKKRYRFTGKERDDGSGLYYFGARYYASWLCRFTSVDPLKGESPGLSPYHYSSNNPINRIDPTGMKDEPVKGAGNLPNGPFDKSNVFRKDNGVLVARRITTNERRAGDAYMGIISAVPITRVTGTAVGLTYEAAKMYNEQDNTFGRDAGVVGAQKATEYFFDQASKDAIVGQNQGMMKAAKNIVGKVGTGISLYNALDSFSSDPTANETMGLLTFSVAESGGLGNINISNEGLFEFNVSEGVSEDQAINTLNTIDATLSTVLSNYDLSNVADQEAAKQFVSDNIDLIKQTVNSSLDNQSNNKSNVNSQSSKK